MRRHWISAVCLLVVLSAPAAAADQATKTTAEPAPKPTAKPATQPDAAPRTLEDINIEGKIAVPQVLFITARDQRRFMGFQHRRYLKTSLKIGEEAVFPSWIVVIANPPQHQTKETSP